MTKTAWDLSMDDTSPPDSPSLHIPVLSGQLLQWLDPRPGQCWVDATLGGGGHARLLARRVSPSGRVLAIDRDPAAVGRCRDQLAGLGVQCIQAPFAELPRVLAEGRIAAVDGAVMDLGLSSDQLADATRGFSFRSTGTLDLRFDPSQGQPAWQLLARLDERRLADLIYQFGEERLSRRIARAIARRRQQEPIRTAQELADIIHDAVPAKVRRFSRIDPATRTFQALRIAVNDELGQLQSALDHWPRLIRPGGRLAIISFHSLEDRLVKRAFRDNASWEALTRKPIRPDAAEIERNPRARSARLRVAQRTESTDSAS